MLNGDSLVPIVTVIKGNIVVFSKKKKKKKEKKEKGILWTLYASIIEVGCRQSNSTWKHVCDF